MSPIFCFRIWFHVGDEDPETCAYMVDAETQCDAATCFARHPDSTGCVVDRIENLDVDVHLARILTVGL